MGAKETSSIKINGKPYRCDACESEKFWYRSAMLNTGFATFFGFDWANRSANCFVCNTCTKIHWFYSTDNLEITGLGRSDGVVV